MKRIIGSLLLGLLPFFGFSQSFLAHRDVQVLADWQFHLGSDIPAKVAKYALQKWEPVKVPHTWNGKDVLEKGFQMYKGQAWYETKLNFSRDEQKRYFLRFEGVAVVADVFLNNELIGQHRGSYTAFIFEVTDFLRAGENVITVGVSNAMQMDVTPSGSDLYPPFGGIYRPVKLFSTDKVCISPLDYASSGVYASTPQVSNKQAMVKVESLLSYKATANSNAAVKKVFVETNIRDKDGNIVATAKPNPLLLTSRITQNNVSYLTVKDPVFWDAKRNPYLYSLAVEVKDAKGTVLDKVVQPLGIRSYEVTADKGFFLNGKKYDLYGTTRHQEWAALGSALNDEHHRTDMNYIMELGANMLRLAHYPQADIMYSMADTNGMVIWAEVPVTPPYRFNFKPYIENTHLQLEEMIKQLYNHPSILFWGMQNESHIPADNLLKLHQHSKTLDPYRPTTQGDHTVLHDRHFATDLVCWNRYYGWYGGDFDDLLTWRKKLKESYPNLKVGVSEYGAGGSVSQQQENPERPDPVKGKFYPEQYQRIYHEETWRRMKQIDDDLWCKIIWNTFDFSWETVDRGDRPFINHKGLMTHDRKIKKDAFYFYKNQWNTEPLLYLLDRRFVERSNAKTEVGVYTNQPNPILKVNGKVIKGRKYDAALKKYTWPLTLKAGENRVEVEAGAGKNKLSDACVWVLKQ